MGAKKIDIMKQFLVESAILSLAGGIIGISSGLYPAYHAAGMDPGESLRYQ